MRHPLFLLIAAVGIAAIATPPAAPVAQATQEAPADADEIAVMVLGSYHFTASTSDLVSADPGDVRSPARQAELQRVADAIAAFEPTVVAVERVTDAPAYVDPHFVDFSPADYASSQDERVQLGYRLAQTVGIDRVYGIDEQSDADEPDYFPFDDVMAAAEAHGDGAELQDMVAGMQAMVTQEMARLEDLSVGEALYELNTGELSAPDFYYRLLAYDSGETQPGATLNGYWFMRNAKIFAKLMDVTSPGDRVVVLYGAGHKFWLEHLAEQTPGYRLVLPDEYLQNAR